MSTASKAAAASVSTFSSKGIHCFSKFQPICSQIPSLRIPEAPMSALCLETPLAPFFRVVRWALPHRDLRQDPALDPRQPLRPPPQAPLTFWLCRGCLQAPVWCQRRSVGVPTVVCCHPLWAAPAHSAEDPPGRTSRLVGLQIPPTWVALPMNRYRLGLWTVGLLGWDLAERVEDLRKLAAQCPVPAICPGEEHRSLPFPPLLALQRRHCPTWDTAHPRQWESARPWLESLPPIRSATLVGLRNLWVAFQGSLAVESRSSTPKGGSSTGPPPKMSATHPLSPLSDMVLVPATILVTLVPTGSLIWNQDQWTQIFQIPPVYQVLEMSVGCWKLGTGTSVSCIPNPSALLLPIHQVSLRGQNCLPQGPNTLGVWVRRGLSPH